MPQVTVRLFAGLFQLVGEREVPLALPSGATVVELKEALAAKYPPVRALLSRVVCAVGEEYVPESYALRDGDDVALIPPVSGGR
jgi:molybdopterin converting factor subunit 1